MSQNKITKHLDISAIDELSYLCLYDKILKGFDVQKKKKKKSLNAVSTFPLEQNDFWHEENESLSERPEEHWCSKVTNPESEFLQCHLGNMWLSIFKK